jgi:hypothetical protein
VFVLLLIAALAQDEVTLDKQTWLALRGEAPAPEVSPWLDPRPVGRRVRLTPGDGGWAFEGTWTIVAPSPGWLAVRLAGPEVAPSAVLLDGRPAPFVQQSDGTYVVVQLAGVHRLELRGQLAGLGALRLLPAPEGRLELDADPRGWRVVGGQAEAPWADGAWRTGAEALLITEAVGATGAGTLATAQTGLGVTVTDSELEVQARVSWRVRRGALTALALRVPGAGPDLAVEAPAGARVERSGDRVTITPDAPITASTTVSLRWTRRLAGDDAEQVELPRVEVDGVLRTERALTVARATELEVAPTLRGGSPVAPTALPGWAAGLVRGTPVAARTGDASGRVDLLRFVPASQPALIVDVADWIVAVSEEGRAVVQGTLSLRNETASHLVVHLPEGWSLAALQVDGVPANASLAPDGGWRIALPRSVETVDGLLSFPVEIAAWGSFGEAWARGVEAELPLPAVSAPVAVRHVTLNLPRAWEPRSAAGEHGVVDDFTEGAGLAYGFGPGVDETRATAVYKEALQAWMENDFDRAQEQLDALRDMGADNENVARLQSNLTLVDEPVSDVDQESTESIIARRVRGMAQARALDDQRAQVDALEKADEALATGDYEEAEKKLAEAQEYYGRLSRLEQKESFEQELVQEEVAKRSAVVTKAKGESRREEPVVVQAPVQLPMGTTIGDRFGGEVTTSGSVSAGLPGYLDPSAADKLPSFVPVEGEGSRWDDAPDVADLPPEEPVEERPMVEDLVLEEPEPEYRDVYEELQAVEIAGRGRPVARAPASRDVGRGGGAGRAAMGAPAKMALPKPAAEPPPPPPSPPKDTSVDYKQRTEIDFSGIEVSGELAMPSGAYEIDGLGLSGAGVGGGGMDAPKSAEVGWEPLQVTATSASLVIPVLGETVRYQHLLLEAGDAAPIFIQAKSARRSP